MGKVRTTKVGIDKIYKENGGFQSLDLITAELKSHMTF